MRVKSVLLINPAVNLSVCHSVSKQVGQLVNQFVGPSVCGQSVHLLVDPLTSQSAICPVSQESIKLSFTSVASPGSSGSHVVPVHKASHDSGQHVVEAGEMNHC